MSGAPQNTGRTVYVQRPDASGQPAWIAQPKRVVPLRPLRAVKTVTPELFNQAQDELQKATAGARDPGTVTRVLYSGVTFSIAGSGNHNVSLPHQLGSSNVGVDIKSVRASPGVTAGIPQVDYYVDPVNPSNVVLRPFGTFVCDVEFYLTPSYVPNLSALGPIPSFGNAVTGTGAVIATSGTESAVNGTSGEVLTSNGPGVAPSFQPPSGSTPSGTGAVVVTGGTETSANGAAGTALISNGASSLPTFQALPTYGRAYAGPFASFPPHAANGSGDTYHCTDTEAMFVDSFGAGSPAWTPFYSIGGYSPPSILSAWTLVTGASGIMNVVQEASFLRILTATQASNIATMGLQAQAGLGNTSVWSVTAFFDYDEYYQAKTGNHFGICVTTGTTSANTGVSYEIQQGGGGWALGLNTITPSAGRLSITAGLAPQSYMFGRDFGMRLLNDGALLLAQFSLNGGATWQNSYATTAPSGLTNFGWCTGSLAGDAETYTSVLLKQLSAKTSGITQMTVTGATGNGVTIVLSGTVPASWRTGDQVTVHGMLGNTGGNSGSGVTSAAPWVIQVGSGTVTLLGSTGNGTWTSGGVVTLIGR